MQQELRFATFNACNLALPGMQCYPNMTPCTPEEYQAKTSWLADQLDALDADVIGFQEIFSQSALQDVLAKTRHYRHANHVGFDPDPALPYLTPSVALVSRLPLDREPFPHVQFPRRLAITLPDYATPTTAFTRPILQASVVLSGTVSMQVIVLHFKSKRPDFTPGETADDPYRHGIASLRSHIRRGAEALALRYLLLDIQQALPMPLVILGDFNDGAGAASTQLVMGETGQDGDAVGSPYRLFDCSRLQTQHAGAPDSRYSVIHDGRLETIDHILVSDFFNPAYPHAIGEVCEVSYFNDHLGRQLPHASDHAQVVARVRLYGQ